MANFELLIQLADKLRDFCNYYGEFTEHPNGLDWDGNRSYLAYYITQAEELEKHLPEIEDTILLTAKIRHRREKEILRSLIQLRNTTKKVLSSKPSPEEVKREAKQHHKKYGIEYSFYSSLHKAACITDDFSGIADELETDGGIEQAYQQATEELNSGGKTGGTDLAKLPVKAKPETSGKAGDNENDIAIDDKELTILAELAEGADKTFSQVEIEAATSIKRGTLKDKLQRLESISLIHRPLGKRSGYQITNKGREIANRNQ